MNFIFAIVLDSKNVLHSNVARFFVPFSLWLTLVKVQNSSEPNLQLNKLNI